MAGVIHQTFDDPREYQRRLYLANVRDLVVSEPGRFAATLVTTNVGRVWLQWGTESLARTIRIEVDETPRALSFLADREAAPIIQSGVEFGADDVVSFGQRSSHFQRTFGLIRWAGMSLVPGHLEEVASSMAGRDVAEPLVTLLVKPADGHLTRLRKLYYEVARMASAGDLMLDHPEVRRALEHALTVSMVACLIQGTDKNSGTGSHRHQQIMRRFSEWLDANHDRAVYVQEVCIALGISQPTLRRCCEEHLGMSPMQYLWLRRMNLARQEIQLQRPGASVTAAAMNFGFWHLGRFANEYRALFGELPSITMARHES